MLEKEQHNRVASCRLKKGDPSNLSLSTWSLDLYISINLDSQSRLDFERVRVCLCMCVERGGVGPAWGSIGGLQFVCAVL